MHPLDARAYSLTSSGSDEQPLELGGQRQRVAWLEQRAELAVAHELLVLG